MSAKLTFTAEIYENEKGLHSLRVLHDAYFRTRIQKAPLGKYNLNLDNGKENRSTQQNRYYFGICLPLVAEETGDTVEDLHELFRRTLLTPKFITARGKTIKIPTSTTELKKDEFGEYLRKIEVETGVLFPNPCLSGFACMKKSCPICMEKLHKENNFDYPTEESNPDLIPF